MKSDVALSIFFDEWRGIDALLVREQRAVALRCVPFWSDGEEMSRAFLEERMSRLLRMDMLLVHSTIYSWCRWSAMKSDITHRAPCHGTVATGIWEVRSLIRFWISLLNV